METKDISSNKTVNKGGRPRKSASEKLVRINFMAPGWMAAWLAASDNGASNEIRDAIEMRYALDVIDRYELEYELPKVTERMCERQLLLKEYRIENVVNLLRTWKNIPDDVPTSIISLAICHLVWNGDLNGSGISIGLNKHDVKVPYYVVQFDLRVIGDNVLKRSDKTI